MARTKLEPFTGVVRYPVLADLGLHAVVGGYHTMNIWRQSQTPEEIMHKFAHCFRKVWGQMPGADRDTLISHWRLGRRRRIGTFSSDIIMLEWKLKFYSEFSFYRGKYDYALGQCDPSGLHLYFSSCFIKRAGSGDLEYVVAHEMGHAISFARGWLKQHECQESYLSCKVCEQEADRYAMSWGYDPSKYLHAIQMPQLRWKGSQVDSKESKEVIPTVKPRRRRSSDPLSGF